MDGQENEQDPEGAPPPARQPPPPPRSSPADRFGPDFVPEEWELEGPAVSISLGDAADLDPALLAAVTGPGGLGGNALCAAYGQDQAADVLRPGPVLAALTEQAATDLGRLDDEQLMGALSAARRLENRAAYLQTIMIAEFARRRGPPVPPGHEVGGLPRCGAGDGAAHHRGRRGRPAQYGRRPDGPAAPDARRHGRREHRLRARGHRRVLHRKPQRGRRRPRR